MLIHLKEENVYQSNKKNPIIIDELVQMKNITQFSDQRSSGLIDENVAVIIVYNSFCRTTHMQTSVNHYPL